MFISEGNFKVLEGKLAKKKKKRMCTVERDPVILKTFHADLPAMCQGRWDDVPPQNWTPGGVNQER